VHFRSCASRAGQTACLYLYFARPLS